MRRIILILLAFLSLSITIDAQNSKKVKDLKRQRERLQKDLKHSQQELTRTRKDISTHKQASKVITEQLDVKLNGIREAETRMDTLDKQIAGLQTDVRRTDSLLQAKKQKYALALRMARAYRHVESRTLFILSARSFTEMERRARNTNFFAKVMRKMGEELTAKQSDLLGKQNNMLSAKNRMSNLMRDVMMQRHELGIQQVEQQRQIASLGSKEKGLKSQLSKQRNQLAALNKKIDQVVAAEVEAARKRAEAARRKAAEAARKKAEAAARKKAEVEARKVAANGKSTGSAKSGSKTGVPIKDKNVESTPKYSADSWLTAEDRALNGSFEHNKGRLPVPITGNYKLGERFGMYNVSGMNHVQLDNKGTNYIGHPGAHARSIFDGEVTAVFQFYGTKGVLVRHGTYISVYCNLSSVSVSRGQKVHARDLLGSVATNEEGKCVLHFQLRKETAKLNPESWIGR